MLNVLDRVARPIYRRTKAALYAYRSPGGPTSLLSPHSIERVPMKAEEDSLRRPTEDLY